MILKKNIDVHHKDIRYSYNFGLPKEYKGEKISTYMDCHNRRLHHAIATPLLYILNAPNSISDRTLHYKVYGGKDTCQLSSMHHPPYKEASLEYGSIIVIVTNLNIEIGDAEQLELTKIMKSTFQNL